MVNVKISNSQSDLKFSALHIGSWHFWYQTSFFRSTKILYIKKRRKNYLLSRLDRKQNSATCHLQEICLRLRDGEKLKSKRMKIDINLANHGCQKYHTKWTSGQKLHTDKTSSEEYTIPNFYPPNKRVSKYVSKTDHFKGKQIFNHK